MKSLLAASGLALCIFVTACAVDDPRDGQTSDQTAVAATPSTDVEELAKIIYVPPELSFKQLDGTFEGNEFTGITNACHVTLLFCRDSRFNNLPSFCQNGQCGGAQGATIARSLCLQVCGNINCDTLVQVLPNRPGC